MNYREINHMAIHFASPSRALPEGPYRSPGKKTEYVHPRVRKYIRLKARLRGLYRRIVLPTKVVLTFAVIALFVNFVWWTDTSKFRGREEALAHRHADDWEAAAATKQRAADAKTVEVERKEHELNERIRNFEDTLMMSPLLMKDGNLMPVLEAIQKSRTQNR